MLARAAAPDKWQRFTPYSLQRGLMQFCDAIQQNSRGKFGVVFNAARQEEKDYYVDLNVETAGRRVILMPPVIHDVIRDLFANARKYTTPGGKIIVALFADAEYFDLVVADTGRGIPTDEITSVVHFGQRASNVTDVRTHGGGFGLTKAFLATKQFQGRFWIESELGHGTEIRLRIPCSSAAMHDLSRKTAVCAA